MAKLVIGNNKQNGVPAVVKEVEPVEPYPLLGRVKDDSNNDIGIVVGYHTDANNQKYAVVCINATYRKSTTYNELRDRREVANLSHYNTIEVYEAPETATFNCDKINEQSVTSFSQNSEAVTECRSHSFVIGGNAYAGQIPSLKELMYILLNRTVINTTDPTINTGVAIETNITYWSSTQSTFNGNVAAFYSASNGNISSLNNDNRNRLIPVLEIPIQ